MLQPVAAGDIRPHFVMKAFEAPSDGAIVSTEGAARFLSGMCENA